MRHMQRHQRQVRAGLHDGGRHEGHRLLRRRGTRRIQRTPVRQLHRRGGGAVQRGALHHAPRGDSRLVPQSDTARYQPARPDKGRNIHAQGGLRQ